MPEVEVVRRGVQAHVVGRTIERAAVHHPRAVRRHLPGALDLTARLAGRRVVAARRRGKYLWLDLDGPAADGSASDAGRVTDTVPATVAHIARDPLDPAYDVERAVARLRARRTGLKRALLDQTVVSGIGNIYADEALWRARLNGPPPP